MAMHVSARRIGRQVAAAILADGLPGCIKAGGDFSGSLAVGSAGSKLSIFAKDGSTRARCFSSNPSGSGDNHCGRECHKLAEVSKREAEAASKESEAAKKYDEAVKKQAEAASKESEAAKKYDEAVKKQAEAASKESEAAKKYDEAVKKQAEAASKESEAAKKYDEAVKMQAEAATKEAEAAKKHDQAMKKQAEAATKEAEAAKKHDQAMKNLVREMEDQFWNKEAKVSKWSLQLSAKETHLSQKAAEQDATAQILTNRETDLSRREEALAEKEVAEKHVTVDFMFQLDTSVVRIAQLDMTKADYWKLKDLLAEQQAPGEGKAPSSSLDNDNDNASTVKDDASAGKEAKMSHESTGQGSQGGSRGEGKWYRRFYNEYREAPIELRGFGWLTVTVIVSMIVEKRKPTLLYIRAIIMVALLRNFKDEVTFLDEVNKKVKELEEEENRSRDNSVKVPEKEDNSVKVPEKEDNSVKVPEKEDNSVKVPEKEDNSVKVPEKEDNSVKVPEKEDNSVKEPEKEDNSVKEPENEENGSRDNSSDIK